MRFQSGGTPHGSSDSSDCSMTVQDLGRATVRTLAEKTVRIAPGKNQRLNGDENT